MHELRFLSEALLHLKTYGNVLGCDTMLAHHLLILEERMADLARAAGDLGTSEALGALALVLQKLGDVVLFFTSDHVGPVYSGLKRALEILQDRRDKGYATAEERLFMAFVLSRLALIEWMRDKPEAEETARARCLAILDELRDQIEDPIQRKGIAGIYVLFGMAKLHDKDWPAAGRHYQKAFDISLGLVKAHPDIPLYRRDMADHLHKLALVDEAKGLTESARTACETARHIALAVASIPPDAVDKELLAEIDEALARLG